jgi:hypothetical protein
MSTPALITMLIAWSFIIYFALRFLIKVIRTPMKKDDMDGVEMESSSNSPNSKSEK